MFDKLEAILNKYDELSMKLSSTEYLSGNLYQQYSKELAEIQEIATTYLEYKKVKNYLELLKQDESQNNDLELKALYTSEIKETQSKLLQLETSLKELLLPTNSEDSKDIIMEIRAGVGGDESTLFAWDLFNMYIKYAQKQGWKVSINSYAEGTLGGFKEVILSISGKNVYAKLKYEGGVHRVQRVPETEARGRVHTSTATVAVLPERTETEVIIDPKDISIGLFHSGGPGGQNVNKVETGVRITHLPTGMVVACREERSQLQNKERALEILRAKLWEYYNIQNVDAEITQRNSMIGTGDRSEKVRTYNFPQHRVTDHRINYTSYDIENIMQGNLEDLIEHLQIADNAKMLAT